jgi:Zn-dependent protease/CBS domain-containing protein
MKTSLKIAKVAGIEIEVHFTFFLLLLWIAILHFQQWRSLAASLDAVLFLLVIFGTVVLHELCHALTAKHFGIKTRKILLLPIGGVAQMEKIPEKPWEGLLVSLAGPFLNLVIAGILYAYFKVIEGGIPQGISPMIKGSFLIRLMWVNLGLALFNLLPAFPMDGGRILRSILALWMAPTKATQIAAQFGQILAFLFGFIGLLFDPLLVFIGLFIWMGAAAEATMARARSGMIGVPVKGVMITEFRTISPEENLGEVVDHILAGFQGDFPVVEGERVVGVLTEKELLKGLARWGKEAAVRQAMSQEFETARPTEPLEDAYTRMQGTPCRAMPVLEDGKIVGILTPENIGEFLMVQTALQAPRS